MEAVRLWHVTTRLSSLRVAAAVLDFTMTVQTHLQQKQAQTVDSRWSLLAPLVDKARILNLVVQDSFLGMVATVKWKQRHLWMVVLGVSEILGPLAQSVVLVEGPLAVLITSAEEEGDTPVVQRESARLLLSCSRLHDWPNCVVSLLCKDQRLTLQTYVGLGMQF